jgi:isoaspartyl peptidase/L-asparaginase-like protein (Ntn-hydrolase superfamily)
MGNVRFRMALHGGAGASQTHDYGEVIRHMRELIERGRDSLQSGAAAIDVAEATVKELELSGLYIAGRGSSPNLAGAYELDACVMDGSSGEAGAVAALQGFTSPVEVARAVMDRTPHVLLAGEGASMFARAEGFQAIADPSTWFTRAGDFEYNRLTVPSQHGTVGCVVCDAAGRLAAATSTGGVFGKRPGRVGDSAMIGASTWADGRLAVSCTGQGEFFIRSAAAAQVAHRVRFGGQTVEQAAQSVLSEIALRGGTGGLIALDNRGHVSMPFVSSGMKRAALLPDGTVVSDAP